MKSLLKHQVYFSLAVLQTKKSEALILQSNYFIIKQYLEFMCWEVGE